MRTEGQLGKCREVSFFVFTLHLLDLLCSASRDDNNAVIVDEDDFDAILDQATLICLSQDILWNIIACFTFLSSLCGLVDNAL